MAESKNSGIMFQKGIDTEDQVLAIRAKAMAMMAEGKTVLSWTGEGVSSTKQFVFPVEDILAESRLFLMRINPARYGYITNSARQFRY